VRLRITPRTVEPAQSDAELLELVANAHRDALGQLYRRHAAAVRTAARRIMHDTGEAEDLVHDVFLEIWRTAGDYDPGRGSVRTWLLVRAHSRSVDRRRTLSRRHFEELQGLQLAAVAPSDDEFMLRSAVTHLPDPLRELLELGYYVGMSCAEMAAALELPLGTVKSRVARALTELRTRLAEQ
jgi:RNA polymerase sigma-70 factor, ECF subfamily